MFMREQISGTASWFAHARDKGRIITNVHLSFHGHHHYHTSSPSVLLPIPVPRAWGGYGRVRPLLHQVRDHTTDVIKLVLINAVTHPLVDALCHVGFQFLEDIGRRVDTL